MSDRERDNATYHVIRNDGMPYMTCDRETALRLVRQLNERYEGTYSYKAARGGGDRDGRAGGEGANRRVAVR